MYFILRATGQPKMYYISLQHTPQYADKNDVKYNFIPSKQRNAVFSF